MGDEPLEPSQAQQHARFLAIPGEADHLIAVEDATDQLLKGGADFIPGRDDRLDGSIGSGRLPHKPVPSLLISTPLSSTPSGMVHSTTVTSIGVLGGRYNSLRTTSERSIPSLPACLRKSR